MVSWDCCYSQHKRKTEWTKKREGRKNMYCRYKTVRGGDKRTGGRGERRMKALWEHLLNSLTYNTIRTRELAYFGVIHTVYSGWIAVTWGSMWLNEALR